MNHHSQVALTGAIGLGDLVQALDKAPPAEKKKLEPIFLGNHEEQARLTAEKKAVLAKASDSSTWTRLDPKELEPELRSERRQVTPVTSIPILDAFKLDPKFVTKLEFKFSVGRDRKNIPEGVTEFVQTMDANTRMEANVKRASEAVGPEVAAEKRLATRKRDTALALLGDSMVFNVQMLCMLDLNNAGYKLRDVYIDRNSKGEYEVRFVFTLQPFEGKKHFEHCPERRAHELKAQFAQDTNNFMGAFWNDNRSVRINVGFYEDRRPQKRVVVRDVPMTNDPADTRMVSALVVERV